jgi:hypothetical protein
LYGPTLDGGASGYAEGCGFLGCGAVFKLTRGMKGKWTEKVLHSFNGKGGSDPLAGLIFDAAGKRSVIPTALRSGAFCNCMGTAPNGGFNCPYGLGTVHLA